MSFKVDFILDQYSKFECWNMQVWESCSNSLISFSQDGMVDELAYVAENDVILEALNRGIDTLGKYWMNVHKAS